MASAMSSGRLLENGSLERRSTTSGKTPHRLDQVADALRHGSVPRLMHEDESALATQAAERFDAFVVVREPHPAEVGDVNFELVGSLEGDDWVPPRRLA